MKKPTKRAKARSVVCGCGRLKSERDGLCIYCRWIYIVPEKLPQKRVA